MEIARFKLAIGIWVFLWLVVMVSNVAGFIASNNSHENATDMLPEWISAYGKLIPADSISGRFVDGLNTVCLGST
jgi:hypothetical protein